MWKNNYNYQSFTECFDILRFVKQILQRDYFNLVLCYVMLPYFLIKISYDRARYVYEQNLMIRYALCYAQL